MLDSTSQENTLQSLIARCALRDAAALESLYQMTSPKLFAQILRIVNKQDMAEDILQEGFINVWRNAQSYRSDKGSVMAWMSNIMRNKAIDWIRKKSNREDVSDEFIDSLPDFTQDALREVDQHKAMQILQQCLEELETEQQKAILLAYYHGFTHQELSTKLSSPIGTIKSWIRRGIQRLRGCLQL